MKHSRERLLQILEVDFETGRLMWRERVARIVRVGAEAGATCGGRRYITIERARYSVPRLIWFLAHGDWPAFQIDHIDGDPLNNKLANLRDVPAKTNMQNIRRAKAHNEAQVLGVRRGKGGYEARITVDGREIALGSFATALEAGAAYLGAKRAVHAGCTI